MLLRKFYNCQVFSKVHKPLFELSTLSQAPELLIITVDSVEEFRRSEHFCNRSVDSQPRFGQFNF